MYKSPFEIIQHRIICDSSKQLDEAIFTAVVRADIHVDRNELVKALQYDRNQYEKGFEDGKAEAAKWISVKDRLPEFRDWVLVIGKFVPEGYWIVPHIAEFRNGVWHSDDIDCTPLEECALTVTHWMPLPEAPKEDEKDGN